MNKMYYCSGPIEYAKDDGVGWRLLATEALAGAGHSVVDPTKGIDHQLKLIASLREANDIEALTRLAKKIRRKDLDDMLLCDEVLCMVDPKIPSFGTIEEIVVAYEHRMPIHLIVNGGVAVCPLWLLALTTMRYDSLGEALEAIGV